MFPKRSRHIRFVAVALVAVALLYVASQRAKRITPAFPALETVATGSFAADGWYPGDPFAHAAPTLRAWGSWSGDDANLGTLTLGPFPAPRVLRFGLGGYLTTPGNFLHVELAGTAQKLPIEHPPVGERWQVCEVHLPPAWIGRPIRLVGTDGATAVGGWFALTEPIGGGRGAGNNALLETLAAWSINGVLLALLFFAVNRRLAAHSSLPPHWLPLAVAALVALAGYLIYWAYFFHVSLGWILTAALYLTALISLSQYLRTSLSPSPNPPPSSELRLVLGLLLVVGAFQLAVLHLFPTAHDFYTLSANRFREAMPGDNALSHMYAERLFAGEPPKNAADAWQSSDRPPLQIGWQLLTWPAGKVLGLNRATAGGTSAVWFQLLWVAAAYGLLRTFGIAQRRAAAWVAVFALSGFFLQNTTFTWPKLSAAAFATAAFALLFLRPLSQLSTLNSQLSWPALFAALAWLSHGGVAFSFLPLLPFLAWRIVRSFVAETGDRKKKTGDQRPDTNDLKPPASKSLVSSLWSLVFLILLVLPWVAYQKFYDPPGNLLLKYHFAGQTDQDSRGVWQTIRESYAKIGWREAWTHKVTNFHSQVYGEWRHLADVSAATKAERRNQEFFHTGRALTWWPILAVFALALTRRRVFTDPRNLVLLAGWLAATIALTCLLIFGRYNASIHHGSYAVMIGLFVFFTVLLERSGRGWLIAIAALQTLTFATTWAVSNPVIYGEPAGLPIVLATGAVLAWFIARSFSGGAGSPSRPDFPPPRAPSTSRPPLPLSPAPTLPSPALSLGHWTLVIAAVAAALFLRKPHALHTPQLWAEDGSIFLTQNDLLGLRAFIEPYAGYLHTLQRLVAWIASVILDPAWWPAFYNGVAWIIWLAVIARLFTTRFDLPGKPWLALAMIAVPHTGEVFFNITNLQWITAFVLIQQLLISPPVTRAQRVSDILILALVALTGPFGIAFLPLFAWRAWRERRRDTLIALATVLLCAAIQISFLRHGPSSDLASVPLQLWPNLVVLARRLFIWPTLGHELALTLSPAIVGAIGGTFLLALLGWVLRPHPLRPQRLLVLGAFVLIMLAGLYRTRPDTWAADNLDFGDRYFYIPRVLLAWLLIWEFHAKPRLVAQIARIVCVLTLLVHIRDFTLRAPTNYEWAKHVDAIRRGVPAEIPTLPEGWTLDYRGRP